MNSFVYYTPTKVVFGRESEKKTGKLVKEHGGTKVLIHYGGTSAIRSGLVDRVKKTLDKKKIAYVLLGGVVSNPRLSLVYEGIALCEREEVDFILAIGGGSVIDSAKAIAYGAVDPNDVWELYEGKRNATASLPVGVVLTTAATGSEMGNASVITKEEENRKRGYEDDFGYPAFAILNPELSLTLPPFQTACGCADILLHTLERYLTANGNMELTDGIAEALMRTVIQNARRLLTDPQDYNARAEIMWAGSLSNNGLTGCGNGGGDWATHMLEHELSGMFDVTHAAGMTALWGSWARTVYRLQPDRFEKLAMHVLEVEESEEVALAGIESLEAFFRSIGLPTNLKELGLELSEAQRNALADSYMESTGGLAGSIKKLNRDDVRRILEMASGL